MSVHARLNAVESLKDRVPVTSPFYSASKTPADVFGQDVFQEKDLKEKLTPAAFEAFKKAVDTGALLSEDIGDQIAAAMKDWALSHAATHFTHWFQPLHGLTAEKHDSFINFTELQHRSINLNFSGKQLIKGEPDASSFPSGGIRSTFEARGYTAWDMTSPAFLRRGANGCFLLIPTAFCSWTGEALDLKTPLLRSIEAISKATIRMLNLIDENNKAITAYTNLGCEQEFFTIDRGFYNSRPDLVACGRTLLGAKSPKGQVLEDHYFGTLDRRILAFLQDCEWTLWKLGVPATTRHNEVAPSQYEMAPIYESVSVACDHNLLMMEVLREKAREHGLATLLHEKPFAGVNGSGKHNNWSISTNLGDNVLEPGSTPSKNVQFLVFLTATLRAVSLHGDLLRVGIAVPGNDHRLGANEAPPAIMSAYIGEVLSQVIQEIIGDSGTASKNIQKQASKMKLGVSGLPTLPRDLSDRNRTSPFAFTGNKFEFRAVGSSQSCARPNIFLNAIVAESLNAMADQLDALLKSGLKRDIAIQSVIVDQLTAHQRVVFNGNNYSEEWIKEAAKRGLPNLRTLPEAIKELCSEKNIKLFENSGILTRKELESQQHISFENYVKVIGVESAVMLQMVTASIIPACFESKRRLSKSINPKSPAQVKILEKLDSQLDTLLTCVEELKELRHEGEKFDDHHHFEQATFYRTKISDAMDKTRHVCDSLETIVDDQLWPFPKYSEILFLK